MPSSILPPYLRTLIGCAALTAAAGITLGWPRTTHADRDQVAIWIAPGTKVAPTVIAEGQLVRDAKGKWVLEIRARNTGTVAHNCSLVAMVSEVQGSPMSRVAPIPEVVWQQRQSFSVPPRAEATRQLPVPPPLAAKLDAQAPPPPAVQTNSARRQQPSRPSPRPALAFSTLSVQLKPAG